MAIIPARPDVTFGALQTMPYKRHFFVCSQRRPPFAKPSCGLRDSGDVLAALAAAIEERGLQAEIGVTPTGCLGPCESGPSIVVYPEAVWYQSVRPEDVPEMVEKHAVAGEPVERLRYEQPPSLG